MEEAHMRAAKLAASSSILALLFAACSGATPSANPTAAGAATSAPSVAATSAATAAPSVAAPSASAAPTAAASQAMTSVSFRFDWIETPGDTAIRAALDQGFFKANGLDVTTTVGSGSTDAVTLTGAGQFQMGQASALAVVTGVGAGVPVKAVAIEYQTDPNGMISRPDAPIKIPTDLYGKKYGIQQGSSLLYYKAILAVNALDESKITEVPIGFDIAPLIAKQIDGLIDFGDGELIETRHALKTEPTWAPLQDWGVKTYGTTLIVNNGFAASNPAAVKGFVKAYAQGIKWAVENPDAAVAMMQKVYADADAAGLKERVLAALKYFTNDATKTKGVGWQDEARWQTENIDLAKRIGLITKDIKAADVMSNDYLPSEPILATPK
jgi:NitT/TauT family transport system substrate-binding protein